MRLSLSSFQVPDVSKSLRTLESLEGNFLSIDPIPNPSPEREGSSTTLASAMGVLPLRPKGVRTKRSKYRWKGDPDSYREEGVCDSGS